jgi:glycosyltransferase involved in cell wall biosynthesis
MKRHRVLYLDIEGGFGGSSRSLYNLVTHLDLEFFEPLVLCRERGPIRERYAAKGIHCEALRLPAFRPAQRNNWLTFALFVAEMLSARQLFDRIGLLKREGGLDLLHVNHEGLALLGRRISKRHNVPWICHVRTRMHPSPWLNLSYGVINAHANRVIFITENEERHFAKFVDKRYRAEKGFVIHNAVDPAAADVTALPLFKEPKEAFRVICLGSYSSNRGTDLVPYVARALRERGREDFVFFLCGRDGSGSLLPWSRNRFATDLRKTVVESGLEKMVRLVGFVDEPERALMGCHALLQVRRRANPWGREIMEAMTFGLPVVAVGTYQGFVEQGTNGFLVERFVPESIAECLIRLKDDPDLYRRISAANREKSGRLFDASLMARRVEAIYRGLLPQ